MYFLDSDARQYLQRGLLPEARSQSVADELRGWSWPRPPLKPIYAQPLDLLEVAGEACPTGRDLYLRAVEQVRGRASYADRHLRAVVAETVVAAKRLTYQHGRGCLPFLERLSTSCSAAPTPPDPVAGLLARLELGAVTRSERGALEAGRAPVPFPVPVLGELSFHHTQTAIPTSDGVPFPAPRMGELSSPVLLSANGFAEDGAGTPRHGVPGSMSGADAELAAQAQALRTFEVRRMAERVQDVLSRHPGIDADALVLQALPASVELKLSGRLLGLSEHVSLDAVALPERLIFHLRFGDRQPFHPLATTGAALIFESIFEVPVDVGCVVYVRFVDGHVTIERDFHVIGDELRQTFLETREEKMRLLEHGLDPGLPPVCPVICPYLAVCHPGEASREGPGKAGSANPRPRRPARAPVVL